MKVTKITANENNDRLTFMEWSGWRAKVYIILIALAGGPPSGTHISLMGDDGAVSLVPVGEEGRHDVDVIH